MKRVVVTGGSGKAGRAVVADLGDHGYDVTSVDVAASLNPDDPTLVADLTDLGQAIESLSGADAVVHLAAIPAPRVIPEGETFRINMMSTYNVFSAAAQLRLSRVVWASSETLIGIPFVREQPRYAPIDEEPGDVADIAELVSPIEHRIFAGKIDKSDLGFGERAIMAAVRAPEGDFRDWDEIAAWANGIADVLETVPGTT